MDKRTEYITNLSAHLQEWDAQIDLIRVKPEMIPPAARTDYSQAFQALQAKRHEIAVKLQRISLASYDEWEKLKSGAEGALGEVRTLFYSAISTIDWNISSSPEEDDEQFTELPGTADTGSLLQQRHPDQI